MLRKYWLWQKFTNDVITLAISAQLVGLYLVWKLIWWPIIVRSKWMKCVPTQDGFFSRFVNVPYISSPITSKWPHVFFDTPYCSSKGKNDHAFMPSILEMGQKDRFFGEYVCFFFGRNDRTPPLKKRGPYMPRGKNFLTFPQEAKSAFFRAKYSGFLPQNNGLFILIFFTWTEENFWIPWPRRKMSWGNYSAFRWYLVWKVIEWSIIIQSI